MEPQRRSVKLTELLSLGRYHISEEYGFLLPNPLVMSIQDVKFCFLDSAEGFLLVLSPFCHFVSIYWGIETIGAENYVDPDIFYAVIRIFLSGWKDNPAMPVGLVYEGVSTEPLKYSGGSAAQSSVLHAFDEFLGIQHCKESVGFLHRMRDYMPPSHKAFLEDLHSAPSLRDYITASGPGGCRTAYNQCVEALVELRSYHINMVARYIISTATKARSRMLTQVSPHALEDRGTGGTAVLSFLKSVRQKTMEAILCPGA
ncbi:indoleamine 2,3-dioxygenase 2-like [Grammomys surdaster]|uniref:indoleamine 2,3-dioxygenase 2-like n=1 Tax=Grammomys surdaster TaxID=491861 RepID=UPI0010A0B6C9|nr:indoleamine 2,3-dioxygenase 2-like [Grammomys surdaster]